MQRIPLVIMLSLLSISHANAQTACRTVECRLALLEATAKSAIAPGELRAFSISESNTPQLITLAARGWIPADGRLLDKLAFPELYAALGKTWGEPVEPKQFRLPDARGVFLRGYSGSAGNDPDKDTRIAVGTGGPVGNRVGTYQLDALLDHGHIDPGHSHGIPQYSGKNGAQGAFDQSAGAGLLSTTNDKSNIGRVDHARASVETRPRNIAVYYFVYVGRPVSPAILQLSTQK